jgi:ABC-type nickel/cobalt efflux system permease component RcnA
MQPAPEIQTIALLSAGFVFGMKHALDADHLAAISTIVSERKNWLSSSIIGGLWGIGHTISLFVAGAIVLFLKIQISPRVENILESCVGLMLVGLGLSALWKIRRSSKLHLHQHQHGERTHLHPHFHEQNSPTEASHHTVGKRPLLIGLVHGLAGSAALMLLVLSSIPTPFIGMIYIAVFGAGSIIGMMLISSLIGVPFHLTSSRFKMANLSARILAGIFSVGCGLMIIYQKGQL